MVSFSKIGTATLLNWDSYKEEEEYPTVGSLAQPAK
jgi:hypothetical protein